MMVAKEQFTPFVIADFFVDEVCANEKFLRERYQQHLKPYPGIQTWHHAQVTDKNISGNCHLVHVMLHRKTLKICHQKIHHQTWCPLSQEIAVGGGGGGYFI